MGVRLGGGDEPGAHAGGRRPGGHDGGHLPRRGDPASSDHGHVHRLEHGVEQGEQADLAADVPARFDALGHHEVAAGASGRPGLIDRPDLPRGERSTFVGEGDHVRGGLVVEELDEAAPTGGRRHHVTVDEGHEEVDADRAGGPTTDRLQRLSRCFRRRRRHAEHPQRPGVGDGHGEVGAGHAAHARLLEGNRAADESGEGSVHADLRRHDGLWCGSALERVRPWNLVCAAAERSQEPRMIQSCG